MQYSKNSQVLFYYSSIDHEESRDAFSVRGWAGWFVSGGLGTLNALRASLRHWSVDYLTLVLTPLAQIRITNLAKMFLIIFKLVFAE